MYDPVIQSPPHAFTILYLSSLLTVPATESPSAGESTSSLTLIVADNDPVNDRRRDTSRINVDSGPTLFSRPGPSEFRHLPVAAAKCPTLEISWHTVTSDLQSDQW